MSTQLFEIYTVLEQPDNATIAEGEASGLYYRFLQLPSFNTGMFSRRATRWFEGMPSPEEEDWAFHHGYHSVEFLDAHRVSAEDIHASTTEHNLSELALMFQEGQQIMDEAADGIKAQVFLKLQLGGYAA